MIFGLSETWECLEDLSNNAFPSHVCYFLPAEKVSRHGRAMAGLSVYIKPSFATHVKRIWDNCSFGIILSVDKTVFNTQKPLILAFVYLPTMDSPFYNNKLYRGIKLLEYQLLDLPLEIENYELIICGDLNARIGDLSEDIEADSNIPDLEEFEEIFQAPFVNKRVSCDKTVNKPGRE